jgi:hypothetical protein
LLKLGSLLLFFAVAFFCGTTAFAQDAVTAGARAAPAIASIHVTRGVATLHFLGDLWASTWADDDKLYMTFGDGTGRPCVPTVDNARPGSIVHPWTGVTEVRPGFFHVEPPQQPNGLQRMFCEIFDCITPGAAYKLCPFTDSGLVALSGPVPDFALTDCATNGDCVVARDLPTPGAILFPPGRPRKNDKAASLLYVGGRLYYAGFTPNVAPREGYIAFSTDHGQTWTKVAGSPWTGASPFRELVFVNMGRNYEQNTDGYVYVIGAPGKMDRSYSKPEPLYLARVPKDAVAEYDKYEYLAARAGGAPSWSPQSSRAIPLAGISTLVGTGSAMYHAGIGRYLFLAGHVLGEHGELFEAPDPWGPWTAAGEVRGHNIAALIPKDAGPHSVFFTSAGGTATYELNIGRIDMNLAR